MLIKPSKSEKQQLLYLLLGIITTATMTNCAVLPQHSMVSDSAGNKQNAELKNSVENNKIIEVNLHNGHATPKGNGFMRINGNKVNEPIENEFNHIDNNNTIENINNTVEQLEALSQNRKNREQLNLNSHENGLDFHKNLSANDTASLHSEQSMTAETTKSSSIGNNGLTTNVRESDKQLHGTTQNRLKLGHGFGGRKSLHTNLDDLLNSNRNRNRRALRFKRNTNYEDILRLLSLLEDPNDDTNSIDQSSYSLDANGVYQMDDDDIDKLNQFYYQNYLPKMYGYTNDDDDNDDISRALIQQTQPYAQHVLMSYIPADRYKRFQRSGMYGYGYGYQRHPTLSLFPELRRKRFYYNYYEPNFSEDLSRDWGKIMERRDERDLDDGDDEASKIYTLASLLAEQSQPDNDSQRYKRSVHVNPQMTPVNAM